MPVGDCSRQPKPTDQQRQFALVYAERLNATEAARMAGYSHPDKQGARLLGRPHIRALVEAAIRERMAGHGLRLDTVLTELDAIIRARHSDYHRWGAELYELRDSDDLTDAQQAAIKRIKFRSWTNHNLDGSHTVVTDAIVETHDKNQAIRTAMEYLAGQATDVLDGLREAFSEAVPQDAVGAAVVLREAVAAAAVALRGRYLTDGMEADQVARCAELATMLDEALEACG